MRVKLFAEEPLEGINSLDLFLKSQVYTPKPRYFNDLKLALEREVARVDVEIYKMAIMDIRKRAENVLRTMEEF